MIEFEYYNEWQSGEYHIETRSNEERRDNLSLADI